MKTRRSQTINLTIVGVVLLLVASVGAVWLQPDPVEAAGGPVHIEASAEMAEAFASILPAPAIAAAAPAGATGMGLVDPTSGVWHLRTRAGDPASFYFGNPGDYPMMGDWNCDTIDTPGLYRQSDGFVYLRNSNTQGVADIKFYFGDPGDVPLAGDFNGDGCDTVSIYRQTEGQVYIINKLGANNGGLGAADYQYYFGNPGDKPFTGDFNNDGTTTVGLHRESTGFVYFRNTNTQGNAEFQFFFGDPGDRLVAGDWTGDGNDTPALFRPSNRTVYMRYTNTQGNADEQFTWGESPYVPVAGNFGTLNSGVTVNISGAPDGLKWAVESLYQELPAAPHLPGGLRANLSGLDDRPKTQTVSGTASTSTAYGKQVGVVQTGGDTILAVSDNGWEWRVVGAEMASKGRSRWFGDEPRFVTLIGADWQYSQTVVRGPPRRSRRMPTASTSTRSSHRPAPAPSSGSREIRWFGLRSAPSRCPRRWRIAALSSRWTLSDAKPVSRSRATSTSVWAARSEGATLQPDSSISLTPTAATHSSSHTTQVPQWKATRSSTEPKHSPSVVSERPSPTATLTAPSLRGCSSRQRSPR